MKAPCSARGRAQLIDIVLEPFRRPNASGRLEVERVCQIVQCSEPVRENVWRVSSLLVQYFIALFTINFILYIHAPYTSI